MGVYRDNGKENGYYHTGFMQGLGFRGLGIRVQGLGCSGFTVCRV